MSEAKEDYLKAVDERIEKFTEMFNPPAVQEWVRLLLHKLIIADLTNTVVKFVSRIMDTNIEELIGGESDFNFEGEEVECELAKRGIPHAPHVIDDYMTVRYGAMNYYCLGREGSVPLWGYTISIRLVKLKRYHGGAYGRVRVEVTA